MRRKLFLSLCVLILVSSTVNVFASGKKDLKSGYVDINGEKIRFTPHSVRQLSAIFNEHDFSLLPYEYRYDIYEENAKEMYFLETLIKGFGAGSAMQNHTLGAVLGGTVDTLCVASFVVGGTLLAIPFIFLPLRLIDGLDQTTFDNLARTGFILVGVGGVGFIANRGVQLLTVAIYKSNFNKTLRNGLGLEQDLSDALGVEEISFYPIIQPFAVTTVGFAQKSQYGIGCKISM